MKRPLLISVTLLTLGLVTGIYAQTTGLTSSVITKMKAVAANFTLTELIPSGQTGLTSAPLVGKKSGDILTAAEYNRLLEVVAQGNGQNGLVASRAAAVRAAGYLLPIPSTIIDWPDTIICEGYGGMAGGTQILNLSLTTSGAVIYWAQDGIGLFFNATTGVVFEAQRVTPTCGASVGNIATICAAGRCIYGNGTSIGTSSWVDVPLTDTADFNVDCDYRVKMNQKGSLAEASVDDWIYGPTRVGTKVIIWENSIVIKSASKNVLWWQWSSNDTYANVTTAWGRRITKIEKSCGGSGGGSGGISSTPDYESDWKTVTAGQQFSIVHNLSTSRPFKLQTIVRESATKDDEVIHEGFEACVDLSDGQNGGMYFWIDKSDNPENQIKVQSGKDFPCYFHGKIPPGGSTMNWSGPWPSSVQMKVRIWK